MRNSHLVDIVPMFRSKRQDQSDASVQEAINAVLESRQYVLGNQVKQFEERFAEFCGTNHCVSLANGTDALELALRAVGVTPGRFVLLAANAGFYGSTAVRLIGAVPHYIDIDQRSLTLSAGALDAHRGLRPAAVIVTHLYGQLAPDLEKILNWAEANDIPVIEDCAQAHGATRGSKRAGSFGTVGCFSFYPTKNLGGYGDGGAIVTNEDETASKMKQLRQYGWSTKYVNALPGGRNSRLDEIQAAILRAKLPYLDKCNALRREVAARYAAAFADLPLMLPVSLEEDYVAHLFVVRVSDRNAFRDHLKNAGVSTDIHYPIPDHQQAAYPCDQPRDALPVTEAACESVVSLPCFPGISSDEVDRVIGAVRTFFG